MNRSSVTQWKDLRLLRLLLLLLLAATLASTFLTVKGKLVSSATG